MYLGEDQIKFKKAVAEKKMKKPINNKIEIIAILISHL